MNLLTLENKVVNTVVQSEQRMFFKKENGLYSIVYARSTLSQGHGSRHSDVRLRGR